MRQKSSFKIYSSHFAIFLKNIQRCSRISETFSSPSKMWEKSSSGKLPLNFQHSLLSSNSPAKVVLTVFPTGSKRDKKWAGEKKCTNANCPWNSVLFLFSFSCSHFISCFSSFCEDEGGVVVILSASNCFLKLWHKRRKETDFQDNLLLLQHQNLYFLKLRLLRTPFQLTCH